MLCLVSMHNLFTNHLRLSHQHPQRIHLQPDSTQFHGGKDGILPQPEAKQKVQTYYIQTAIRHFIDHDSFMCSSHHHLPIVFLILEGHPVHDYGEEE